MTSRNEAAMTNRRELSRAGEYARAIGLILLTSLVGLALGAWLLTIDVAMLYLLAVVFIAAHSRPGPAVLASALATALLDFLFVPPYYTFGVQDLHYVLTFAVMLAVSLTMTGLTNRLRMQAAEARAAAWRAGAVAALDRELRGMTDQSAMIAAAARHIQKAVGSDATIMLVDPKLPPGTAPEWPSDGVFESVDVRVAAELAHERGESAGSGTAYGASTEALIVPLRTSTRRLGVVAVRAEPAERAIGADDQLVVEALADQLGAELQRTTAAPGHIPT